MLKSPRKSNDACYRRQCLHATQVRARGPARALGAGRPGARGRPPLGVGGWPCAREPRAAWRPACGRVCEFAPRTHGATNFNARPNIRAFS